MRCCLAVAIAAGCGFSSRSTSHVDVDAPTGSDGPIGGGCTRWPAPGIDPCNPAIGTPVALDLAPGDYDLDTGTGMLTGAQSIALPGGLIGQAGGPTMRVINLSTLTLAAGATITAHGDAPVVFVVHGAAAISGAIAVTAGGDPATLCNAKPGAPATGAPPAGGGGGGGGGFGADDAGNGGDGKAGGHGVHGDKGGPSGDPMLRALRGGCSGGAGGDDEDPTAQNGGSGGTPGGALEITALASIAIDGTLSANGTGGGGGTAGGPGGGGGGGGGSGGAILLDGQTVTVTATGALCANGGGGGEGGFAGTAGQAGSTASCTDAAAPGGATNADGGDGGDGAYAATKAKDGLVAPTNGGAGGGGGGGVGRIRAHARTGGATLDGVVTPAAAP